MQYQAAPSGRLELRSQLENLTTKPKHGVLVDGAFLFFSLMMFLRKILNNK